MDDDVAWFEAMDKPAAQRMSRDSCGRMFKRREVLGMITWTTGQLGRAMHHVTMSELKNKCDKSRLKE